MPLPTFLVEDNAIIRTNLEQTLSELAQVQVVGFAAGEREAVDWLLTTARSWRLAIVDLFLSEGNGLGVLAACRVRDASQKLVVLSNYSTPEMRERCLSGFGADAVFDKSTELEDLIDFCRMCATEG